MAELQSPKIGLEYEMEILQGKEPLSRIEVVKTKLMHQFFTKGKYKIDKELLKESFHFSLLKNLYQGWIDAEVGDVLQITPEYAIKALLFELQSSLKALSKKYSGTLYEGKLEQAMQGLETMMAYVDPEATRNMVEIQTGITIDPFSLKEQMALIIAILQGILMRENINYYYDDDDHDPQWLEIMHASNSAIPLDSSSQHVKRLTGDLPYSHHYTEYLFERIYSVLDYISHKDIKNVFLGLSAKGFQVNYDASYIISPVHVGMRNEVNNKEDRRKEGLLLEQLGNVYQKMDALCHFKTLFGCVGVNLFGASKLEAPQDTFAFLEWMKTGNYDDITSNDKNIKAKKSSRMLYFPNLVPHGGIQNGNPIDRKQCELELMEKKIFARGKVYPPFLSKAIDYADYTVIEDRIFDVPMSLESLDLVMMWSYGLDALSRRFLDDTLEAMEDKESISLMRTYTNQSMLNTAEKGESAEFSYPMPKGFLKHRTIASIFEAYDLHIEDDTYIVSGTVANLTDALFEILLSLFRGHPFYDKIKDLMAFRAKDNSFSKLQDKEMKQYEYENDNEGFLKYLVEVQSKRWNDESFSISNDVINALFDSEEIVEKSLAEYLPLETMEKEEAVEKLEKILFLQLAALDDVILNGSKITRKNIIKK